MKQIKGCFQVIFALVLGAFILQSCQSPSFIWSTSSMILTYDGHTKRFEVLWEKVDSGHVCIHDTIYVSRDETK